jgi:hypothetical protein
MKPRYRKPFVMGSAFFFSPIGKSKSSEKEKVSLTE